MSEYIIRVEGEWKSVADAMPEQGETVDVVCAMVTQASVLSMQPKPMWNQDQDISEAKTDVILWRKIDANSDGKAEAKPDGENPDGNSGDAA